MKVRFENRKWIQYNSRNSCITLGGGNGQILLESRPPIALSKSLTLTRCYILSAQVFQMYLVGVCSSVACSWIVKLYSTSLFPTPSSTNQSGGELVCWGSLRPGHLQSVTTRAIMSLFLPSLSWILYTQGNYQLFLWSAFHIIQLTCAAASPSPVHPSLCIYQNRECTINSSRWSFEPAVPFTEIIADLPQHLLSIPFESLDGFPCALSDKGHSQGSFRICFCICFIAFNELPIWNFQRILLSVP